MRGFHPVLRGLSLQPSGQLDHPVVQRKSRFVPEQLPGRRDVGEAVADVADPVLAGALWLVAPAAGPPRQALGDLADGTALAASHIQPAARGRTPPQREPAGAGDVVDADEVPPLLAV